MFGLSSDVRTWSANALFWSGNFAMALGATFASGGCLVLQRYFAEKYGDHRFYEETEETNPTYWLWLVDSMTETACTVV